MTNEEIQGIFFVECEEALGAAESALDICRDGGQDAETINSIFRAVHSIKGGAGAFGFTALQAFTHGFETLLSDVRDEKVDVTGDLVALMLRALDLLSDHVTAARDGGTPPEDACVLRELAAAQAGGEEAAASDDAHAPQPSVPAEPEAAPVATAAAADFDLDFDLDAMLNDIAAPEPVANWLLYMRPLPGAMRNGGDPMLFVRELERLGGKCTACNTDAVPTLDRIDPEFTYFTWTVELPTSVSEDAVRDIFDFVGDDCLLSFNAPFDTEIDVPAPVAVAEPAPSAPAEAPAVEAPAAEAKVSEIAPEPMPAPVAVAVAVETIAPVQAAPAAAAANAAHRAAPAQSVRIDLAKLDRLIDSVGELVIAQAMMAQRLTTHGLGGIEELALLDGLTRDIQEGAMAIRAQPIGSVFSRVPRMLRELENTTGKKVKLLMSGENTELDKTVVERLGDPLTHLIRNAVDHGVEKPEDRIAAGKPAEGTLTLSAEQRSGRVVIRIADDGRGIDRERVFEKAVEKGLVAPGAHLSDEEIDNLIFAPGFSTAATISSISGRGVGMDVVRQNVKDLGGRITIESRPGKGTTFTLALPLTLAISDGMIVTVGDQTLVVPLTHVVESLRPEMAQVQSLGAGRKMLNVRGQFIPIVPVDEAVGANGAAHCPSQGVLIVVDTEAAGQAALLVDGICDQRQFVIKSLDAHYHAVEGVAGATILGDGRVALIVDVDVMVGNSVASAPRLSEAA